MVSKEGKKYLIVLNYTSLHTEVKLFCVNNLYFSLLIKNPVFYPFINGLLAFISDCMNFIFNFLLVPDWVVSLCGLSIRFQWPVCFWFSKAQDSGYFKNNTQAAKTILV